MPRRLNRPGYGWSYTYGKGQRTVTPELRDKLEQIKWDKTPMTEANGWQDGKNATFGNCKRKVFK
ncbi:MAG: hypothetical protein SVV67_08770 [Bacillota bacterium]|nr:hypothetical protein [Bacillota bacterium]